MDELLNKNNEILSKTAAECSLFLKREDFEPIKNPCDLFLIGNGVRHTLKGGTGSGDVFTNNFINIEQAFINAGFNITSKNWLDCYDSTLINSKKQRIQTIKKEAKKYKCQAVKYCFGYIMPEKDYDISLNYSGDLAIYVLSRQSGEGHDRKLVKGDIFLTQTEIKQINYLNENFKHFLLVLNVGGYVDLSCLENVKNILLLSQLGTVTSSTLVDIVLGNQNPSGKLAATWAKISDYKYLSSFGDMNDTIYSEDIFVGYRYFDSFDVKPMYEFGFGLSYTNFEILNPSISNKKSIFEISYNVKNIGDINGKEVVQVYIDAIDNDKVEYQKLIGFKKTLEIGSNETIKDFIIFDLKDYKSYDSKLGSYVIYKGQYIIKIGNSSRNLISIGLINIENDIILGNQKPIFSDSQNFELKPNTHKYNNNENIKEFNILSTDFTSNKDEAIKCDNDKKILNNLSNEELCLLSIGHFGDGFFSFAGSNSETVFGAAGETTLRIPSIKNSLVMADGPAGLRLTPMYGKDEKGNYPIISNVVYDQITDFLPRFIRPLFVGDEKKSKKRNGVIIYQNTTAIPIATACAQSFNENLLIQYGDIVGKEMNKYHVHIWLAPAMNIQRNILCGRNFEYFSEDPFLTGKMAAAITKGVQSNKNCGVTIKHFLCNNQEFNRFSNNSIVSERAFREIYARGYEITIKDSRPLAIMTSYNLLNGIHTCENPKLLNDLLRKEWGFDGIIMTDWMQTSKYFSYAKYDIPHCVDCINAGVNLYMPGHESDYKELLNAVKKGRISEEKLTSNALFILKIMNDFNN